jgi:hypothetical protein
VLFADFGDGLFRIIFFSGSMLDVHLCGIFGSAWGFGEIPLRSGIFLSLEEAGLPQPIAVPTYHSASASAGHPTFALSQICSAGTFVVISFKDIGLAGIFLCRLRILLMGLLARVRSIQSTHDLRAANAFHVLTGPPLFSFNNHKLFSILF